MPDCLALYSDHILHKGIKKKLLPILPNMAMVIYNYVIFEKNKQTKQNKKTKTKKSETI